MIPVSGMVESYDLVSPWGLEYKTAATESSQQRPLPSDVHQKLTGMTTYSVNERQGITTIFGFILFVFSCSWIGGGFSTALHSPIL